MNARQPMPIAATVALASAWALATACGSSDDGGGAGPIDAATPIEAAADAPSDAPPDAAPAADVVQPPGTLDKKITTDVAGKLDVAYAVLALASGKIVIAGSAVQTTSDMLLIRYDDKLNPDPTFGTNGIATVSFAGAQSSARGVALQSDGKLVVAGQRSISDNAIALARVGTGGTLDTTFGTGGRVITDFGTGDDGAEAIALQADGRIVVAGHATRTGDAGTGTDLVVLRYTTAGVLDASFGTGGKVLGNDTVLTLAHAVAIQSDGRIVITGETGNPPTFFLARDTTAGALDTSFGTGGKVTTAIASSSAARAIAIQSDGKLVVAGEASVGATPDFALARYMPDGSLDATFGNAGTVITDFQSNSDIAFGVAIAADGKIVAAGQTSLAARLFGVARYTAAGALDPTFGAGGKTTTHFFVEDSALAVALQKDGRIVAAGYAHAGPNDGDVAIARYFP